MKAFAQLWFRVAFPVFAALFAQPAAAGNYHVTIADGCAGSSLCLAPNPLVIHAGSTVAFAVYCGGFDYFYDDYACTTPGTQRHNIVADDGSFRCARGCDGDGGYGTPAVNDGGWGFTRIFHAPGMVRYHDEGSGSIGLRHRRIA